MVQNLEGDIFSAYREKVLYRLGLLGLIVLLPLAVNDFLRGQTLPGLCILSVMAILGANAYAVSKKKSPPVPQPLLVLAGIFAIGSSLKTQGFYGAFWSYPAVLFFYFVLSRRAANFYNLILVSVVTVMVYYFVSVEAMVRFALTMALTIISSNIFLAIINTLQSKLLEQSIVDPLTGAMNRRHMEVCLEEARERKRRHGRSASLLLFDIDYFKQINDQYGHSVGDDVLKEAVTVIKRHSRKIDLFFRVGGDEFVLLLPDTGEEEAATAAEHLRASIRDSEALKVRNVSITIGVSELGSGESLETWLKHADDALYRAKGAGRNRVVRRAEASIHN